MNPFKLDDFMVDDCLIEKDYDYMHLLIPETSIRIFESVEEICDRLEYEGSFLYDEYPDKTTLLNLTDKICEKMSPTESISPKDLIMTLLCDEILFRRCRYYHKSKKFKCLE